MENKTRSVCGRAEKEGNTVKKITTPHVLDQKGKEKIAVLTAYDYPTARRLDEAGIEILLVGDSLEMVLYGSKNTLSVSMETMLQHTVAVSRAAKRAMVVSDMPFLSYQASKADAIRNAGRFLKESGAEAVKLEGGEEMADTIKAITSAGIPVMAHIGLTPQSIHLLGGFKRQGKTQKQKDYLLKSAKAVAQAGAFSVVLECIEEELSAKITEKIQIPTIGIGSGSRCDGQILVTEDLLGLTYGKTPNFVDPVDSLGQQVFDGALKYIERTKGFRPGLGIDRKNRSEKAEGYAVTH